MPNSAIVALVVGLSTVASLILLNALRKIVARKEWDGAAFFGAASVLLTVNLVYVVVTYRGEWIVVANRLGIEWQVADWGGPAIRLVSGLLAVVSVVMVLRALGRNAKINTSAVLFLAMTIVASISAVLHGDNPIRPYAVVFFAVLVACTVAPRGVGIHVGIGTSCLIVAIASGVVIAIQKDFSVLPCLNDKCGVFGFNYRGIFNHENGLAMFLVLAMPFVYIGFASWEGPVLSAYLLGLVLLTGSRSSSAAAIVTFAALVLLRPSIRRPFWAPGRTALLYLALAAAFVVSFAVPFITDDPTVYTGRGTLWILARDALSNPATLLYGEGMLGWQRLREAGLIGFSSVYSVHNQWLHVLYSTGLMGFMLLLAAIVVLIWQAGRQYSLVVGCVLVPVFLLSVTERPWPIDTADWLIWTIPGALLCYPATRGAPPEGPEDSFLSEEKPAEHSADLRRGRSVENQQRLAHG